MTQSIFNPEAVEALSRHWLEIVRERSVGKDAGSGSFLFTDFAADILQVGVQYHTATKPAVSEDAAFDVGVRFGLSVACAVAADPLGDPTNVIENAAERLRAILVAYRKSQHRDNQLLLSQGEERK
jgi:hypothetical protein